MNWRNNKFAGVHQNRDQPGFLNAKSKAQRALQSLQLKALKETTSRC
jgi:hypothetical protein